MTIRKPCQVSYMERFIYLDYLVKPDFDKMLIIFFLLNIIEDNFKFLFTVRLGGMLSYTPLDERSIQLLLSHFHDFLQYLQKNNAELFNLQQDYTDPPPDYHRKYG